MSDDIFNIHNRSLNPVYAVWANMKQRCLNPNFPAFHDYGGRGITICQRWIDSYDAFLADMGPRPSDEHSIERRRVNGNYEPGNCYWATELEQQNNKRNNVFHTTLEGTFTEAQLAQQAGMSQNTLRARLAKGQDIDTALSTPVNNRTYTHEGITLNLSQWAERTGIPYKTLYARIVYSGWSFEKAIQKVK